MKTMDTRYIDIAVSVDKEQLISTMGKLLKSHPHGDILARVIVNNLEKSQVGISQLINGFIGMEPSCVFEEGQEVLVNFNALPTWRFGTKMKENDMLIQGNVKATILSIDLYKSSPITVEYEYLDSSDKLEKGVYEVGMHHVFPLDNELELE